MVAPINYIQDVQTPFQAAAGGLQLGSGIVNMQAEQQAQALKLQQEQQAMEQQRMLGDRIQSVMTNPNPTAQDYAHLSMLMPKDQAESTRKAWDMLSADKQQTRLSRAGQVLAAFNSGANDIAQGLLAEEAAALRNSGDEQGAKAAETYAKIAEINPAMARTNIGLLLSQIPGGDKVIEGVTKLGAERRAEEKAPFELSKAESEAKIKKAEARFAPEKFGAELGLTRAQIDQARAAASASRASAAKSGAEASRATAEARQITAGVIPADKRPEAEGKFRKEYSDQTKGYQEVKSAYGRVLAASNPKTDEEKAIADVATIFGYMKMLDPGSVVREGEYATAANTAAVPDQIKNLYNRVIDKQRLTDSQRKTFKKQAEKLYNSASTQEKTVRDGLGRIAKGYGLSPENIFYESTETAPTAPAEPNAPPAQPRAAGRGAVSPAATRSRNVAVDY